MFNKINRISLKVYSGCNFKCSFCHQLLDDKNKPYIFNDYIGLKNFLLSIPLDDIVDITITGGEITLAEDSLLRTVKILKQIERVKDVRFDVCIITNGSNMNKIYDWIDKKIICPIKTSISWDGIHNSKSRLSCVSDDYYLKEIRRLGQTEYNDLISIVHSINPSTIDYLADSFKFCIDNNVLNIGYYFIHEANYEHLKDKFTHQIEKIAQMVVDYYHKGIKVYYFNWQNIYTSRKDNKNFFLCNKLGNNYHIDMFGDIYPCIYFGDHRTLKIGDLTNGLDENKIKEFEDSYLRKPNCDFKNCKCYHCSECPASNYVHNHSITERFKNICELQKIENEVFDKYAKELYDNTLYIPDDVHNHLDLDDLQECLSLSINDTGIVSPNYNGVREW